MIFGHVPLYYPPRNVQRFKTGCWFLPLLILNLKKHVWKTCKSRVFTQGCHTATHFTDEETEVHAALTGGGEECWRNSSVTVFKMLQARGTSLRNLRSTPAVFVLRARGPLPKHATLISQCSWPRRPLSSPGERHLRPPLPRFPLTSPFQRKWQRIRYSLRRGTGKPQQATSLGLLSPLGSGLRFRDPTGSKINQWQPSGRQALWCYGHW
jgi:hypothetical protein